MIYLFYGSDSQQARTKWQGVAAAFTKKYPDGSVFRFDADQFDAAQFEELINSVDLFGGKRLIMCDHCSVNPEAAACLEDQLEAIAESRHVFAFLEGELKAAELKKFEKAGAKVQEFALKPTGAKTEFNPFAIADAVQNRDRKTLWLLYQEALDSELTPEEIFWKLVWPIKTMLLVRQSRGKQLKTIKPFVAGKAERGNRHYQDGELEKISSRLVALWHESKESGDRDLAIGLEQLILGL